MESLRSGTLSMGQSCQKRMAAMKKKRCDVMGLWD
jgi:hypothetical protein